ncbi:hypothetical protein Pelo_10559 [Pelomyxa schiedti]|nr:hypothetical protein Pelo_10559 [Pelomyxa schiedti]
MREQQALVVLLLLVLRVSLAAPQGHEGGECKLPRRPAARACFEPTPRPVVDAMVGLAALGPRDVVADLGCGDGAILLAAAEIASSLAPVPACASGSSSPASCPPQRCALVVGVEVEGGLVARAQEALLPHPGVGRVSVVRWQRRHDDQARTHERLASDCADWGGGDDDLAVVDGPGAGELYASLDDGLPVPCLDLGSELALESEKCSGGKAWVVLHQADVFDEAVMEKIVGEATVLVLWMNEETHTALGPVLSRLPLHQPVRAVARMWPIGGWNVLSTVELLNETLFLQSPLEHP